MDSLLFRKNIPARKFEPSVKQLTDLTSLNFKSTDFNEQMEELTELVSPDFENGDFKGQLEDMEHLSLKDFMSDVREDAQAPVLVEFETTEAFDQECNKVIMAYMRYLIQEIQAQSYNMETLRCVSYKIDLTNEFREGVGVDTIPRHKFESVEQAKKDISEAQQDKEDMSLKQKEIVLEPKDVAKVQSSINEFEKQVRTDLNEHEVLDRKLEEDSIR